MRTASRGIQEKDDISELVLKLEVFQKTIKTISHQIEALEEKLEKTIKEKFPSEISVSKCDQYNSKSDTNDPDVIGNINTNIAQTIKFN